jgi:phosphoesterase RecJ-like protein
MLKDNTAPKGVWEVIKRAEKPICIMDSRLDLDALCAPMAIKYTLKKETSKNLEIFFHGSLGKKVTRITDDYFDVSEVKTETDPNEIDLSKYDLLCVMDSGKISHLTLNQDFVRPLNIPILNIDHHTSNTYFGNYNYVKVLGSTCTVIYYLLKEAGVEIDKKLGEILLIGALTDNGFFQYNTTTSEDFRMAAALKDLGVDLYQIIWKMTFNVSYDEMKLRALVYNNLVIEESERCAYSTISQTDLLEYNLDLEETTTPPADLIKKLNTADYAFVVKELEETNIYNVSIRSHYEWFDSSAVAKTLGGGGHKMAAGSNIQAGSLSEAIGIVLKTVRELNPQKVHN